MQRFVPRELQSTLEISFGDHHHVCCKVSWVSFPAESLWDCVYTILSISLGPVSVDNGWRTGWNCIPVERCLKLVNKFQFHAKVQQLCNPEMAASLNSCARKTLTFAGNACELWYGTTHKWYLLLAIWRHKSRSRKAGVHRPHSRDSQLAWLGAVWGGCQSLCSLHWSRPYRISTHSVLAALENDIHALCQCHAVNPSNQQAGKHA